MKLPRLITIITSIVLGAATGALWFAFGDFYIEPVFGQPVTWYVLPVILDLIFSSILFFLNFKKTIASRIVDSFLFLVLYYAFFWTPLYVIIIACFFLGPM